MTRPSVPSFLRRSAVLVAGVLLVSAGSAGAAHAEDAASGETTTVPAGVRSAVVPGLTRVRHTFTVTAVNLGSGATSARSAAVTPRQ